MAFSKPREHIGGMLTMINKKKEDSRRFVRPPSYVKLKGGCENDDGDECDGGGGQSGREGQTPKGHVPVMVGKEETSSKRFVVPTRLMKDPTIADLLEQSAEEFGYHHQGVVQIKCDPGYFEAVLGKLSKRK